MIGSFAFLVAGSANQAAARAFAVLNRGTADYAGYSWTLTERDWSQVGGQVDSADDRRVLEYQNSLAVRAYLCGALGVVTSLLSEATLAWTGADGEACSVGPAAQEVGEIRTRYVVGNRRLAFVLVAASFWGPERSAVGRCSPSGSKPTTAGDCWPSPTIRFRSNWPRRQFRGWR